MTTSLDTNISPSWLNAPETSVNSEIIHKPHKTINPKIHDNILEAIGNTPLVRLNSIPKSFGLKCEFLVKCEFMNPGGSVKDRIGQKMIEDAEKQGLIKPGYTLIEATAGNTGIGLCLTAAVKGYKMIITLPEKMSAEKCNVLKALGAEVVRTPTEAAWDSPESHMGKAKQIRDSLENSFILDQFSNISNPVCHYDHTGQEIVDQCQGKLDYFFAGTGTGGTMTGIASKIKEVIPTCKCIAVDPPGSALAPPKSLENNKGPFHVEGIGQQFLANVCVRSYVDDWIKANDREGFEIAKRLIKEEGLLVGGSSGCAVAAAINYALENNLNENHRIVILLADSARNYISKFIDDNWMIDQGFMSNELYLDKTSKLYGKKPNDLNLRSARAFDKNMTVDLAFEVFDKGAEMIPIIENNQVKGVLYSNKFMSTVEAKNLGENDTVEKCICKEFITVDIDTDLSIVKKFLERYPAVLVQEKKDEKEAPILYVVTSKDLVKFFRKKSLC